MTDEEALNLLAYQGDPIERHIVQFKDPLAAVIYTYAGTWADHVYSRRKRENPAAVCDEWMNFAGSHYTAMIRLFHAWQKHEQLLACSTAFMEGDRSATRLLQAHEMAAGFWEHIGSAIDNLALCFEDAPCIAM